LRNERVRIALTFFMVIGAAVVLGWLLISIREVLAGLVAGGARRDAAEPSVTIWRKGADGKKSRVDPSVLDPDDQVKGFKGCPQCGGWAKRAETRHSCGYEYPE
jgi:hypothetical protein